MGLFEDTPCRTCFDCKYFKGHGHEKYQAGNCHANPPVHVMADVENVIWVRPLVNETDRACRHFIAR